MLCTYKYKTASMCVYAERIPPPPRRPIPVAASKHGRMQYIQINVNI